MVTNLFGNFVALNTVINASVPCLSCAETFPPVPGRRTRPIGDPTTYHMHRTVSAALTP